MRCRDLESDLVLGIGLSLAIDVIDTNWHAAVFGGKAEYDVAEEQTIQGFYRDWLRASHAVLARLDQMEAAGFQVQWARQFRRACRDAQAVATPDAEFFAGDALIELRDSAIDAHRDGMTAEFHELGD